MSARSEAARDRAMARELRRMLELDRFPTGGELRPEERERIRATLAELEERERARLAGRR